MIVSLMPVVAGSVVGMLLDFTQSTTHITWYKDDKEVYKISIPTQELWMIMQIDYAGDAFELVEVWTECGIVKLSSLDSVIIRIAPRSDVQKTKPINTSYSLKVLQNPEKIFQSLQNCFKVRQMLSKCCFKMLLNASQ